MWNTIELPSACKIYKKEVMDILGKLEVHKREIKEKNDT
jgi:hypothetical protein